MKLVKLVLVIYYNGTNKLDAQSRNRISLGKQTVEASIPCVRILIFV